jgi:RNA polymerase sigma-70 factor (ECF subfamily)
MLQSSDVQTSVVPEERAVDRAGRRTTRIGSDKGTDGELVARAQNGSKQAFELLVRKYQSQLIHFVGRLVGEADACDVAQETFIKAYRAIGSFRGESAFSTWLCRIGINTAKNYLVSRRRRPLSQDVDVTEAEHLGHAADVSTQDTPEAELLSDEIKHSVFQVINKLPPDLRQAITLRELEGLSYEEIAETMGCPLGTVRSRIFRAREAIDQVLQPLLAA